MGLGTRFILFGGGRRNGALSSSRRGWSGRGAKNIKIVPVHCGRVASKIACPWFWCGGARCYWLLDIDRRLM